MSLELSEELLVKEPERIAADVVDKRCPTDTQIRKFYDDFMLLKQKTDYIFSTNEKEEIKNERFTKEIKPMIMFSKAKMAYSVGRSGKTGYSDFYREVTAKLSRIESRRDFDLFLKFYEAIIAFVKFKTFENKMSKQNENRRSFKK